MEADSNHLPKAFGSHATEDQQAYAEPLARRLRERSIDAWYSEWEISGGDSIVKRIFSEGIKQASAFIIILSKTSVAKAWVQAELDVAVVNNIEHSTRLIPVRVDDCQIPESLRAKHYLSLDRYVTIQAIGDAIANSILGQHRAPPLGEEPVHIRKTTIHVSGLRPIDTRVAELAYDVAVEDDGDCIYTTSIMQRAQSEGITKDQLLESIDVLFDNGWFAEYLNRYSGAIRLPHTTILALAQARGHDVAAQRCQIAAIILAEAHGPSAVECDDLIKRLGIPGVIVQAIIAGFHEEDFFNWSRPLNGTRGTIFQPTSRFKRWLEDQG